MMSFILWQRYLLQELAKVFFLVFFSIYFLYALIDSSIHLQAITKEADISLFDLLFYYLMLLSKQAHLLSSLSFIVSAIKVLCAANRNNELLALQTAGISLFVFARPFFLCALLVTLLNLLNFEYFRPTVFLHTNQFKQKFLKKRHPHSKASVHTLLLNDGTKLIYQYYFPKEKKLLDVFLIESADSIWHMKELSLLSTIPKGKFVDYLARGEKGLMEKKGSFATYYFPNKIIDPYHKQTPKVLLQKEPISHLWHNAFSSKDNPIQVVAETHLYFKLIISFLPLFSLLGFFPFCIRSSRNLPVFLIFSRSIFSYLLLFTCLDACIILGENEVIPPYLAIFALPIPLFLFFGIRFFYYCTNRKFLFSCKNKTTDNQ